MKLDVVRWTFDVWKLRRRTQNGKAAPGAAAATKGDDEIGIRA
jgi:hypothetical protein